MRGTTRSRFDSRVMRNSVIAAAGFIAVDYAVAVVVVMCSGLSFVWYTPALVLPIAMARLCYSVSHVTHLTSESVQRSIIHLKCELARASRSRALAIGVMSSAVSAGVWAAMAVACLRLDDAGAPPGIAPLLFVCGTMTVNLLTLRVAEKIAVVLRRIRKRRNRVQLESPLSSAE
jgi:hypothetical protein